MHVYAFRIHVETEIHPLYLRIFHQVVLWRVHERSFRNSLGSFIPDTQ